MKDTIKAIGLFVVGLTVAASVYPVMHELAHSLVAIAVGARVVEIIGNAILFSITQGYMNTGTAKC